MSLNFAIIGMGRMGKKVDKVLTERGEDVVARIDLNDWTPSAIDRANSAIIFVTPSAGYEVTKRVLSSGVDAIVATTGFYRNPDGSLKREMIRNMNDF